MRDDAHEGGGESGEEEVVVDEVGGGLLDTEESGEWVVCVWIRRRGDDGQRKSGERRKNERHRVSALVGEGGRERARAAGVPAGREAKGQTRERQPGHMASGARTAAKARTARTHCNHAHARTAGTASFRVRERGPLYSRVWPSGVRAFVCPFVFWSTTLLCHNVGSSSATCLESWEATHTHTCRMHTKRPLTKGKHASSLYSS